MRMMPKIPHQIARSVGQAGISLGGTISWTLGRQRSGPSIDMWPDSVSSGRRISTLTAQSRSGHIHRKNPSRGRHARIIDFSTLEAIFRAA